ncbi:MAG: helix-turn-helix domain-containing protein, partial [Bacillota bacterium]|nr:helix-turn-helix domain-containing protein [Bacillota bacterium]
MYIDKVPQDMIDLANKYQVPLLVFRRLVRFIDLSRNLIRVILEYVNQDYIIEKQKLDDNFWMLDCLNGNLAETIICEKLGLQRFEAEKNHWFTTVVEYRKSKITYQWSESIYLSIAKVLRNIFEENQFVFYPFFANGLLTGIVMDYGSNDTWKKRFSQVSKGINENTRMQKDKPHLILACGYRSHDIKEIPRSYKTALATLNICHKFQTEHQIYEDLNLYFILALIKDSNHMDELKNFVFDQLKPLLNFDVSHKGKLLHTLKKYYSNNGSKQLTAQELNISRQSLYYRLEQIEEILGVDPLKPERRLTMEMCLAFYDYFLKMQ